MKKQILTGILALGLLWPAPAYADDTSATPSLETHEPVTKLEKAIVRHDKLVAKEFYRLGDVAGSFNFSAAVVYTPEDTTQEKIFGVIIELTDMGVWEQLLNAMAKTGKEAKTGRSYVDFDEIAFMIGALSTIEKMSVQMQPREIEYSEVVYSTRNNDQFGFYQKGRGQTAFARVAGVGKELSIDDLKRVREFLQSASGRLKEMGAK